MAETIGVHDVITIRGLLCGDAVVYKMEVLFEYYVGILALFSLFDDFSNASVHAPHKH